MAIIAMCMPILAGKKEQWRAMMDQVSNDPNFAASREDAGVHGLDVNSPPPPMPKLVFDSRG